MEIENDWKKLEPNRKITYDKIVEIEDHIKNVPKNLSTPYDFFKLIFDDTYINKIVENSNEYKELRKKKNRGEESSMAEKKSKDEEEGDDEEEKDDKENKEKKKERKTRAERMGPLTYEKIEKFLACKILMGIIDFPSISDYFVKDPLLINSIKSIMTENMFININAFIHPEKAKAKGHDKIMESIKYIMENSQKYYYPNTFVTIDERMISYKGRSDDVVYEIAKPTKYGFRPYVLSDLYTGYTYCFKLLEDLEEHENGKMFGLVSQFMNELERHNDRKVRHVLATDGLYTNEMLLGLDTFDFVGSIRKTRINSDNEEIFEDIPSKSFEYYYKEINNKEVILTKYNDSKIMYVVSNFINVPESVKRIRWDKRGKKFHEEYYPNTVFLYSRYMKGVDLSNQIISYYELNRKTLKWWKRIFFHLIDISLVNSFIIYSKVFQNKNMNQKTFRIEVARGIVEKYNVSFSKIKNISNYKSFHFPVIQNKSHTCKNCSFTKDYTTKKTPTSKYICNICGIHLCITCFKKYHERVFK